MSLTALSALVLMVSSAGCRRHRSVNLEDGAAVRIINAVSGSEELTLSVNDRDAWHGNRFRSTSGYRGTEPGNYSISMATNAAQAGTSSSVPIRLEKGGVYTVVAVDPKHDGDPLRTLIWKEDRGTPVPQDQARVLFVHAGPDLGPLAFLVNNIVAADATRFAHKSDPMLLNAGTYSFKVIAAESDDVRPVIGPVDVRLEGGRSYTIIAMGRKSTNSLALEAYSDRF
ncbi:hypothetical protein CCAX7_38260 [Capsulimonas corticalis]|uniref:Uncharacterized protein n=1 Tax=Capsulimonas corticalis TaxID=2219043 RepID=A0A402D6Q7_9BACT|nr:DUF4397 domain-containing protein [Capsulimonas corticalis]BDI31775.1 hypothetical protein CCAX7_38260 [Capsulimonas corticalis]